MAGHEDQDSKANSEPEASPAQGAAPFGTPSPLHREKPIIEGQAIHVPDAESEKPEAGSPAASGADESEPLAEVKLAMEELLAGDEELADREAASAKGEPPEASVPPPAAAPPPHRGLSALSMLAVALIGAATGFASAYAVRLFLDDSQKTFTALDQRITAMNAKLDADQKKSDLSIAGSRDALSALEKRLAAAEKSAGDALGVATTAQKTAAQKAIAPAADANGSAAATVDLAPLQASIDALDQRLSQIEATVNAPKTAERAPQEPEAKLDPQEANAPAIAIVAGNLTQKIASGAPFATELAALEKLGVDKTKLAALQPAAGKGIVTIKALADQFAALTPALLASEKPASPPDENVFARILHHAAGLVRVRKLYDLKGEDMEARVARVKDALAHDDVDRALQEWASFPEAAKTTSAAWAEAAKAQIGAVTAAKAIASDAMANLAKVKS